MLYRARNRNGFSTVSAGVAVLILSAVSEATCASAIVTECYLRECFRYKIEHDRLQTDLPALCSHVISQKQRISSLSTLPKHHKNDSYVRLLGFDCGSSFNSARISEQ
jgi:hypothetical protein